MRFDEYLLTCLVEECVETAHAACKVQRFTPDDHHPSRESTNIQELTKEFNDLLALREMLMNFGYEIPVDRTMIDAKKARVYEFAHMSKRMGVITDEIVEGL